MSEILSFDKFRLDLQDDEGNCYNLLDDISFSIQQGHAVGVVGESGCGKSMTSLSVMRLLPPVAKAAGGSINLCGDEMCIRDSYSTVRRLNSTVQMCDCITAFR